jgi:hypothetical protein
MNHLVRILLPLFLVISLGQLNAQEDYEKRMETLKERREQVEKDEKEALKEEILEIDRRLEDQQITEEEARTLKEDAARNHALNIQDRLRIIDSEIALLKRNKGEELSGSDTDDDLPSSVEVNINIDDEPWEWWDNNKPPKYDRRTYSDLVLAFGLNNAIIEGQSLNDTPYKVWGSRYFEIGWQWRTRVFRRSNFMRITYGLSFEFNGLKPKGNNYFVSDGETTELEEFEYPLRKSKFRVDRLVFPLHFEFGPSRYKGYKNHFRYSLHRQFRFGIGGYAGIKMSARQKLKYSVDGKRVKDKLIGGYNTNDFIYGLSSYIGVGSVLLNIKYDLIPIFRNQEVDQRNIALGLRFNL